MVVIGKTICKVGVPKWSLVHSMDLDSFCLETDDEAVAVVIGLRKKFSCLINMAIFSKAREVVRKLESRAFRRTLYNINISEGDLW